jgi:hypothetical protein
MLAPKIRKLTNSRDIFIERALPADGNLFVKVGADVKPYTVVGECSASCGKFVLPANFVPTKTRKSFYTAGQVIGKVGKKQIAAPYSGTLEKAAAKPEFHEVETHVNLLAGVWGTVSGLVENRSILIKTQTIDLHLAVCTNHFVVGELMVLPNSSEFARLDYIAKFVKNPVGKILYVGNNASMNTIAYALSLGVGAVLAGGCEKSVLDFAKNTALGLGIINCFGDTETPIDIFKLLNTVSPRLAFFDGERGLLRIPCKESELTKTNDATKQLIYEVKAGDTVQVLQKPYMCKIGIVDRVGETSIFVRFGVDENEKAASVEIVQPNFFLYK